MERVIPIPPGKDGGLPEIRDMNELYKILRHVEIVRYPKEMSCILTDFVEGTKQHDLIPSRASIEFKQTFTYN